MSTRTAKMTYSEAHILVRRVSKSAYAIDEWLLAHEGAPVPEFLQEEHAEVIARAKTLRAQMVRDLPKAEKIVERFKERWFVQEMAALDTRFRKALSHRGISMTVYDQDGPRIGWNGGIYVTYTVGRNLREKARVSFNINTETRKHIAITYLGDKTHGRAVWEHSQMGGRWPMTKIVRAVATVIREGRAPVRIRQGEVFEVKTDVWVEYESRASKYLKPGALIQFDSHVEGRYGREYLFNQLRPTGTPFGKPILLSAVQVKYDLKPVTLPTRSAAIKMAASLPVGDLLRKQILSTLV